MTDTRFPFRIAAAALVALLAIGAPAMASADDGAPDAPAITAPPSSPADGEEATGGEAAPAGAQETVDAAPSEEAGAPASAPVTEDDAAAADDGDGAPAAAPADAPGTASAPAATPTGASAPASTASLAAGTYTITANLYVAGSDAPIGVNAYLTDAGFPPITPQRGNATLVVGSDGSLRLTVTAVQQIFTLQHIGDADNATVLSAVRGGSLTGAPAGAPYTDRITDITFLLADAGGQYTFTDVIEYPTALQVEKTWPIHLSVDFAGAVRHLDGDFEKVFADDATGVTAVVTAEAGSPSIARLQDALFTVTEIVDADLRAAAGEALTQTYTAIPDFRLYTVSLAAGGSEITLDARARARLTVPAGAANASLHRIDGAATRLESDRDGAVLSTSLQAFGTFAVVDDDSAEPWAGVKHLTGDIDGVSLSYATTGFLERALLGMDFSAMDSYGMYNAYFAQLREGDRHASAARVIDRLGAYDTADVEGVYALGLDLSMEAFPFANQKHTPFLMLGEAMQTSLRGTVPATADSALYLVSGTAGGGLAEAERLDATVTAGVATFSLASNTAPLSERRQAALSAMWNAASGWDGMYDTSAPDAHDWTDSTPLAYVVVAREAPVAVERPVAATGLVYTGAVQTGVSAGEGYTLSASPRATDAGEHVAIATLEAGHVWTDGSSAPIAVTWSIAKARLTAEYLGETVAAGAAPQLAVEVTGFVGAETAADAAGFTAPTVSAPAPLVAGTSHTLTPAGGSAANYGFSYRSGVLRVTEPATPDLLPGTYRVTANLFVPAAQNDILGLTAYMTNPKNPLVPEGHADYGIPTSPVSGNAAMVVGVDGSRTLRIGLPNPAFTLIGLGAADGARVLGVERDGVAYGANADGRITQVFLSLAADAVDAVFRGSHVYAAPLRLDKTWDVHLSLDLADAVRVSGDTTMTIPADDGTGSAGQGPGETAPGGSTAAPAASAPKTLRPGTYTVTANIWLSRADTGLPLNPHLTSGAFPPMDPVTGNASLTVDARGDATVTVPIRIQSRIMTVRDVSGPGVSVTGSGAVSSVTIALGRITDPESVITRTLTASVTIGDLAMSIGGPIFGGTTDHTWPATFELNLSGVPTSGGGAIPAWATAALLEPGDEDAGTAAEDALDAARQANQDSKDAQDATAEAEAADEQTMPAGILWAGGSLLVLAAAVALALQRRRAGRADAL